MNIQELLEKFIQAKNNYSYGNYDFFNAINTISDYIMYEQSIILKNSINRNTSSITYVYDSVSYDAINDFYDSIKFLSEPIIGTSKSVVIDGLNDPMLSKKVYILDKIKDSFMHLDGDNTKYVFSDDSKKVTIRNVMSDYSLECEIDISALRYFCDIIKEYYVEVDKELQWIDYLRISHNLGIDIIEKKEGVLKIESIEGTPEKIYSSTNEKGVFRRTESDYLSYHTYSYLTSLNSERKDNYPIIASLYSEDVFCDNPSYKAQFQSILDVMNGRFEALTRNVDNIYIPNEVKIKQAINLLDYCIKSIGSLNGQMVRSLRNARAHANKTASGDGNIYFFDLEDNTSLSTDYKFALRINNQLFITLCNEINYCPTLVDYTNSIHNEIASKEFNLLFEYFEYLNTFLYHALFNGYDIHNLLNCVGNHGNVIDILCEVLLQESRILVRK